ncbi:DUF1643 domain-containing protein [Bacillus altitudinis]|uniref:DUF1643 domain-containing protein n=1 Tax=Bacillus altitudinis TaxID=293387 RepID=UPI001BD13512|nr:DUF1643 domain-containing protein [Bacillus altitudinis]MBS4747431.1 DUF1643 domain-containing protein [Bacillus altitudinis]MBS4749420.1 DUF1643 domain-containing protein [Bacillus altitudinis]
MTVDYPDCINEKSIHCDCTKSNLKFNNKNVKVRFCLVVEYKSKDLNADASELIVLLKNPSHANKKTSDRTINKVISVFEHDGNISRIIFLNVLPFYLTDSSQLPEFDNTFKNNNEYEKILDKNIQKLQGILISKGTRPNLICAYGKEIGNKNNMEKVEDILKKYPPAKLKKFKPDENVPLHPQRLPINYKDSYQPFNFNNKEFDTEEF